MGKIKNALISWNQDNGYPADTVSGWCRKKTDGPTITALVKVHKKNRETINNIIKGNKDV